MKIDEVMNRTVFTCRAHDTLKAATQLMWDHDIGAIVVTDNHNKPIGMVTDRDLLMCAYTSGRALDHQQVAQAMSKDIYTVQLGQTVRAAEAMMRGKQVRRLVVVDAAGKLSGILSLNDLALAAGSRRDVKPEDVAITLASICQPRPNSAAAHN